MGLLDTKQGQQQPVGGLLGMSEPQKAGVFDYVLAAVAGGGLSGAAQLGLQQRQQRRNYARQQPYMDELAQAFAPRQAAPQMQGPGMDGAPVSSPEAAPGGPSLESLAPLLLGAKQSGVDVTPYLGLLQGITAERTAEQPKIFNTARGLLSVGAHGGAPQMLWEAPAKERNAPAGYRWNEDGDLEFIPGGGADPKVIGSLAGVRRDVIVKNPLPSRARAKATGGGSALPPGYVAR